MSARGRITTVTLNAAIDKTYYVPSFETGKISRIPQMFAFPGGKGINVARVLSQLGNDVVASGFVAGSNGDFIERALDEQGIAHDFVRAAGESRLCLNIIDQSTGSSTELLEPGPTIDAAQTEAMRLKIRELAKQSRIVIFSGSVPKGIEPGIYAELVGIAKAEGATVFLDSSNEALLRGIEAKPFMIKPNEDEMAALLRSSGTSPEDVEDGIRKLLERGLGLVAVSLGAEGAVVGFEGSLYRVTIPRIEAVNTVGCGDSFVAGMASGFAAGEPIERCLALAAAAGSANALMMEAGNVRPDDVQRLLEQVSVTKL